MDKLAELGTRYGHAKRLVEGLKRDLAQAEEARTAAADEFIAFLIHEQEA